MQDILSLRKYGTGTWWVSALVLKSFLPGARLLFFLRGGQGCTTLESYGSYLLIILTYIWLFDQVLNYGESIAS
jgi:hypothetical protein